MMNERTQIAFKLILVHLVLPAGLISAFFFISNDAYLLFCIAQTYLFILFLSGYWEFFGNLFKMLFFSFCELILFFLLVNKWLISSNSHFNFFFVCILALVQAYLIVALAKIMITIFKTEKISLEIVFPLRNGKYLITDGGNSKISRLMNYHFYSHLHRKNKTNNSMLFATDIVKIDRNKKRFLPAYNEEYPIFGEKLYAPMEGTIIKTENKIDDNTPFIGTYPYNTGNTVVIKNDNYYFLLGHLKKRSIIVSNGNRVKAGELIGQIGNSGYSERPHLHMQLIKSNSENYWLGQGLCIRYKVRNLYKNRLIKIT